MPLKRVPSGLIPRIAVSTAGARPDDSNPPSPVLPLVMDEHAGRQSRMPSQISHTVHTVDVLLRRNSSHSSLRKSASSPSLRNQLLRKSSSNSLHTMAAEAGSPIEAT